MNKVAAYLGLGSNVGDRARNLAEALRRLDALRHTKVTDVAHVYETDPVGVTDQPLFLNTACRIETALSAEELLASALRIERELGRVRTVRWGPRTIDIDLLLYGNLAVDEPNLTIPHPRLQERQFVMIPLLDVMRDSERDWRPGFRGQSATDTGVRRWIGNIDWRAEFGLSEN